jgi:hypothetical protein
MNGMLFLKQRLRELFRVEGLQVVRLLAEADEFDGQCRGAMGIAGGLWRVETRVTPSVSISIPRRR